MFAIAPARVPTRTDRPQAHGRRPAARRTAATTTAARQARSQPRPLTVPKAPPSRAPTRPKTTYATDTTTAPRRLLRAAPRAFRPAPGRSRPPGLWRKASAVRGADMLGARSGPSSQLPSPLGSATSSRTSHERPSSGRTADQHARRGAACRGERRRNPAASATMISIIP